MPASKAITGKWIVDDPSSVSIWKSLISEDVTMETLWNYFNGRTYLFLQKRRKPLELLGVDYNLDLNRKYDFFCLITKDMGLILNSTYCCLSPYNTCYCVSTVHLTALLMSQLPLLYGPVLYRSCNIVVYFGCCVLFVLFVHLSLENWINRIYKKKQKNKKYVCNASLGWAK